MKDGPSENFRWAAHTGGLAIVKPKDYELAEQVDAGNPYEVWRVLKSQGAPLRPGDLLEEYTMMSEVHSNGRLFITKYIGFEPAQWFVPEPKAGLPAADLGASDHPSPEARPVSA